MREKILHLCLANFYIDNFSYQENMLSKYHKKMGFEVEIITSLFTFDKNGKGTYFEQGKKYINEHGIPVTRLNYQKNIGAKKLRQYVGTYEAIKKCQPDIIFIHGCQFLDIKFIVEYAQKHPEIKIYVDNHADFSNSASNWLSKKILHKMIWKRCAQLIEPYTTKFYGVLPARVDFLIKMYDIPEDKIELLVMGADDENVREAKELNEKLYIRQKYNIKETDFLIMTGGKIDDAKKETLLLMQAVKNISNENIKLIVFGSVIPELQDEVNALTDGEKIQFVGWIESEESYKYFVAADLVVFPGRHSVFWEQVVAQGIPMIVKWWDGTTHIDIGGNVKFLYKDSVIEIEEMIKSIINNNDVYKEMYDVAKSNKKNNFLYSVIGKKSIS